MNRDLFAASGGGVVDATTDPYFNSTTLLLSGDGTNGAQNNTFVDSSANNATITRAGSPTQGSFSPFSQTGWSGYFNGTGNYLYATNSVFNPGATGAWTLECFVYPLGNGTFYSVGNGAPSGSNMMSTYYNGSFGFAQQNGSSYVVTINSASSYTAIQWYHYAVSKDSSNVIRLFINGIQVGTQTYSSALTDGTTAVINGRYDNNGLGNTGATVYLSQLRWMKGTSLYTTTPFAPPTAPLTAITGTSLLTLQDNRFKDNSTNNFAITASGTPSVQAFSPFAPTAAYSLPAAAAGSAYFNGSTNLTVPASSQLTLGAGDYTIECWFNITGAQSTTYGWGIAGTYDGASNGGWSLGVNRDTGVYGIDFIDNNAHVLTYGTYFLTNTWYHLALVKSGSSANNLKAYVNGIQVSAVTYNTADTTVATCYIGSQYTGQKFPGYISNLRVVKGTAVYTGNFTPSATPLSKIQSAGTNIAALSGTETSLLTLQDSTFKDNSVNVATITASSPAPVIQSFTPFTQVWGGYFDGSGYSTLAMSNTTSLAMGTGNFTIEFWINTSNIAQTGYVLQTDTSPNTLYISLSGSTIRLTNQSTPFAVTPTLLSNTWYHIAVMRSGTSSVIYTNGVAGTAVTCSIDFTQAGPSIGNNSFIGYISNFRIVKGVAVYTGAFTPPAKTLSATQAAGTNISAIYPGQTSLLTLQDPTFKDNAILPNTITATGTPKTQLVSAPFTSAATVDPVNGSGYFDGSSYLSVPPTSNFAFGTGDFTVECYIYGNSTTFASGAIFSPNVYNGGSLYWAILTYGGNVTWQSSHGNTNLFAVSAVAYYNTWLHITVVRSSGTTKMYFNGVQVASAADSNNYVLTTTYVIARNGDGPYNMGAGYLSNFRIVKGTAVYTAAFQPPTAPLTAITNTSLLTLQDTTFIDNSTNALAITAAGSPSMRAFTPFASNWGGYFASGEMLSIASSSATTFATGDFTIEFWLNAAAWASGDYNRLARIGDIQIGVYSYSGQYLTYYNGTGFVIGSGILPATNKWHHIAVCRSSGTSKLYLNGVQVGSSFVDSANFGAGSIDINNNTPYPTQAYISNFRIVKGTAVYTTNFQPPSAPLTAITNTSLLTLQNNTFIDNSSNAATITAVGAPKTQLLQLPFTSSITKVAAPWNISVTAPLATVGGSMYFTGSSTTADKIAVTSSVALGFGTGAYTIEYWYNPSIAYNGGPEGYSFDMGSTGNGTRIDTFSNSVRFYYNNGATALIATAGVGIQPGAWYHLAIVRTVSSDITIYINGVACGTVNSAANETSTYISIGGYGGPTYNIWGYTGYISNFRVVKGTAVYTGAFTPPAAPPQPTQTPGLLGTNVNAIDGTNTSLLLLGSNAGIYDATAKNDIITVGNAQVSSTQIKYGTGAMYFDGTGDYLLVGNPAINPNLNLGAGDFTIEAWVYPIGTSPYLIIGSLRNSTGVGCYWLVVNGTFSSGGTIQFGYNTTAIGSGTNILAGSGTLSTSTWSHIAVTRSGANIRCFVNGTQVGTTNTGIGSSAIYPVNQNIYIGQTVDGDGYNMNGYLDDLRITKYARYTIPFTSPTKAMIGQ